MTTSEYEPDRLPADIEAERLILGSIVLRDDRFLDIVAAIGTDEFFTERHRRIYSAMCTLHERGERIDRLTIAEELRTKGHLESVGLGYLVDVDQGLPHIPNLESYIRIVKDKSLLRSTIQACAKIIEQCYLAAEPTQNILDAAAALIERVQGNSGCRHGSWVTPYEVLERGGISRILFPEHGTAGLKTPWPKLTEMTSGWSPGDLVIVAGRPGMGKSVIAMQQALSTATQGVGIAFISLEMSKESLVRRLVAGISRVDSHRARSACITADERRRMLEAAADLENLPLFIDDTRAHTPTAVAMALRKLRTKGDIGMVIVDHLQLMKATGRAENRHHELAEIAHGFKRMAGQMECVVLLLSQLNRQCEIEKRRPNLSDLKESGAIEEDADVVAFIHRPEMYKRDDPNLRGHAELIVAKQRNGPTGKVSLQFFHEFQVFESVHQ